MGDDTWLSVFPASSFSKNLSFPFDSFNVEDLHTVDNGIVSHLFPLLSSPDPPFDILIAHFLGVDHVGHRLGPDNPSMRAKLDFLNSVLKRTIDLLPPKTLLIVLGDHGMDSSGDHGGDGVLETSTGLWIYSRDIPLFNSTRTMPQDLLEYRTFPGSSVKSRAIEQIDLVPSLALLLGLPIPYNSLGSVIPELFWQDRKGKQLEHALSLNAEQIMTYLKTYRDSPLGSDLDDFWDSLSDSYTLATQNTTSQDQKLFALLSFTRSALKTCRSIWAHFNPTLICFGLLVLSTSFVSSFSNYNNVIPRTAVCTLLGLVAHTLLGITTVTLPLFLVFVASFSSSLSIIILSPPPLPSFSSILLPLLHTLSFLSNSFTFWEDHTLPFLLLTSLLPHLHLSLSPTTPPSLRNRSLAHLLILSICTRLMAISTVCREEQQPYCSVTFFASHSVPEPPRIVLYLIIPIALALPAIIQSRTHNKHRFFNWVLRPSLLLGTLFWIIEWIDSANHNNEWATLLRTTRTRIAWTSVLWLLSAGGTCWFRCPTQDDRFLILWSILFSFVWLCTQLTGQAVLALGTIAFLSYLQVIDCTISAESYRSPNQYTPSPTPLALLALLTFYSTGHQATFSAIQWKAGFVLNENVYMSTSPSSSWLANLSYPLSGLTVILNSIGGIALFGGLGAGLVSRTHTTRTYFLLLLLGSSIGAAILRRHLMVWKVFAPRFMLGVLQLLVVDVTSLVIGLAKR